MENMNLFFKKEEVNKLSQEEATEILERVFSRCFVDANSIPVEQLENYSNYKTEKLAVQKAIAVIGLVAFILLPLWFIAPRFTVSEATLGERNLPVYTVEISNPLPIYSVTAVLNGYSLPIYQKENKVFTIEPTTNGTMTVTVELFSHQWTKRLIEVTEVDSTAPVLLDSTQNDDSVYLYIQDDGVGINYSKILAIDTKGQTIYPEKIYEDVGCVEFSTENGEMTVYVYDYVGNELSVKIHE